MLFDDSLPHGLPKITDLWQNAAMSVEENPLSKREQEILTLVARGLSNQEIAKDLVISQNTVKVHLRNIFAKLEAVSRTDAVVKAAQAGWVEVGGLEEETGESPVATEALRKRSRPNGKKNLPTCVLPFRLSNKPMNTVPTGFAAEPPSGPAMPVNESEISASSLSATPRARAAAHSALTAPWLSISSAGTAASATFALLA